MIDIDEVLSAYAECAVWTSLDYPADGSEPVPLDDAGYSTASLADETLEAMRADVAAFVEANATDLADLDPGQIGHDFWLTRNHHGAGFWDRGLGTLGDRLTDAAHAYGESDLYVGDDDRLYVG